MENHRTKQFFNFKPLKKIIQSYFRIAMQCLKYFGLGCCNRIIMILRKGKNREEGRQERMDCKTVLKIAED